mmetsp:Transcript_414/g.622  ORF Transcript_414/g.622 Transcript_414/m.622 type:complete len:206 (-) Transcript_414:78-695(-)|eukprot:CAMPEP_0201488892 /NCGR_PEP_ID=MMETSP0151_2-20130828/20085_1 /ASSEMBLY_ACC=CAM_ASM_000257 /TAXON_ID=200890 /ORGANISM="Paramoeba atlantica, Strain 621/1 / CCAP 1560/9" /LENGTH=205 /DNA_ID=CAMNT_0047874293 /DNA_START=38 /DNA_END=655 /DNA_ORIENTATION=-
MPARKTAPKASPKAPRASKATKSSSKGKAAKGKGGAKKSSTQAKQPSHPPYKVMIIAAIRELKTPRKGVSSQAILKFIIGNYHLDPGHHLKTALKNGVEKGYFIQVNRSSYKLGPKAKEKAKKAAPPSEEAPAPKKKAAPAAKKKSTPKKSATTKGKKKAAPAAGKKGSTGGKKAGSKLKRARTMAETAKEGRDFLRKEKRRSKK